LPYPVDHIAEKVYAWERSYVERSPALYLSRDQVISLVTKTSWRERIKKPEIRFISSRNHSCVAHIDTWMLDINDWGRTPCTVLHEMAHLVTAEAAFLKGEDPHGPLFVAKCIDLYHHFIGIPLERLISTARMRGIEIGPLIVPPKISHKPGSSFEDIDF
jgi:hypothetical protein